MRRKLVSTWPVFFVIAMLMFAASSSVTAEVPQFHSAGSLGGVRLMNASSAIELTGPDGGNWTWVALAAVAVVAVAVVAAAVVGGAVVVEVAVAASSTGAAATNRSLSPGVAPVTPDEAAQIAVEAFD
jgi:hypothetical protein